MTLASFWNGGNRENNTVKLVAPTRNLFQLMKNYVNSEVKRAES